MEESSLKMEELWNFAILAAPILVGMWWAWHAFCTWDNEISEARAFNPEQHVSLPHVSSLTKDNFEMAVRIVHTFNFLKLRTKMDKPAKTFLILAAPAILALVFVFLVIKKAIPIPNNATGGLIFLFLLPSMVYLQFRLKKLKNIICRIKGDTTNAVFKQIP